MDRRIKIIDVLRFPMTFLVVLMHQPIQYSSYTDSFTQYLFNFYNSAFTDIIPSIAVPIFFLISGYLYFYDVDINGFNSGRYLSKSKSRVRSLLIPYLIWNLIACIPLALNYIQSSGINIRQILILCIERGYRIFWDAHSWSTPNWFFGLISAPDDFLPQDFPLWYLRNLLILMAITPAIYKILLRYGHKMIWLLGVLYIADIWIQYAPFDICGVFFFSWGCYLGMQKYDLEVYFNRYKRSAYILALIFMIASVAFQLLDLNVLLTNSRKLYILFGVIAAFNIASFALKHFDLSWLMALSETSFFVYALHILVRGICMILAEWCVLLLCKTILYPFGLDLQDQQLITSLICPFINISLCVALYFLMKRYMHRPLAILTGDRI